MNNIEYVKYGYLQGDGSLGRLNSDEHLGLEIHIGFNDLDIFELFNIEKQEGKRAYYTVGYNDTLKSLGFSSNQLPERTLPNSFNKWEESQKILFLKGLYSANGSVIKVKNNKARITLKTTCKKLADQVKLVLESFGFHPYITTNKSKAVEFKNGTYQCKESYDLNIGRKEECLRFYNEIGFVHKYKMEKIKECLNL